ncbi:hypothetical protein RF11_07092 [Thelohanellus kitauei]|uniref:Uncharacterized protein n=1 Tax=Thelohanellus kitauei TaxID=669202 RepID=A0A0C2IZF5_THEKT|nr:hypothetical protein RF11_07092 [Thelohanellus kitauei]
MYINVGKSLYRLCRLKARREYGHQEYTSNIGRKVGVPKQFKEMAQLNMKTSNFHQQAITFSVVKTFRSDEIYRFYHDIHYVSHLHDLATQRFLMYNEVTVPCN